MNETFRDILVQQQMTNRLLVMLIRNMWRDSVGNGELFEALRTTGATLEEIAQVIGTTPGTVADNESPDRPARNCPRHWARSKGGWQNWSGG